MQKFQKVRGTKDLFGEDIKKFNFITNVASEIAEIYGFEEVETPIFELSDVFERNLGETSDIVSKEVYKFKDRGNDFLTLRPEFTSGIVRFLSENQRLIQQLPRKLFSYGPVFRYDRPQSGRQRQFHQLNYEAFGPKDAMFDAEIISLGARILEDLGLSDKVTLEINSLGCEKSRAKYEDALIKYLKQNEKNLSEDSKVRLQKNPLRILDSKDEGDKEILKKAPLINEFYEEDAKEYFEKVLKYLEVLGVEYKINPLLVRGLDYYTSIVFEFTTDSLGAQGTVLAGGRYDNMMNEMSGQDIPAVGFASGVERLMLMLESEPYEQRPISVIPVSEGEEVDGYKLLSELRNNGIKSEMIYGSNMKKRMKRANSINSLFGIIIGEDEVKKGVYKLKNFDNGEEVEVDKDDLIDEICEEII
jgi:histidyl-tRNA synthetase